MLHIFLFSSLSDVFNIEQVPWLCLVEIGSSHTKQPVKPCVLRLRYLIGTALGLVRSPIVRVFVLAFRVCLGVVAWVFYVFAYMCD